MKRYLIAFVVLFAPIASHATSIVPMSVEELTRDASVVVEARALKSWSQWNPERTLIYTYTQLDVARALKGSPARTITVKQLGGSADGLTQKVSGVRHFSPGDEALLFLRPSQSGDEAMAVVGLIQGNFKIYSSPGGERMASNGVNGVEAVRGGKISVYRGSAISLRDIETRVRVVTQ